LKTQSVIRSPLARGKKELLGYLQGKRITRSKAMAAKCYECMNGYVDGRMDCKIHDCPLYPWMPFSKILNPDRLHPDRL
jgi:hypothetical protein